MFNFIKRQKDTTDSAHNEIETRKQCSLRSEGYTCDNNAGIFNYHSRLAMSLESILQEPDCLSHFLQYLELHNALPLIKFYLDATNFRCSAQFQTVEQAQTETASRTQKYQSICDLSMHKPLTDDEKCEIYAETNKEFSTLSQSTSCDNLNRESGNVSAISTRDAIAIYQKYLGPCAPLRVTLPVSIMSNISLLLCQRKDGCVNLATDCKISENCFEEARSYVLETLEQNYVYDFIESAHYSRYCLELIENSEQTAALSIFDILYNDATLFFLMEYLELHNDRICLEFWTAAIHFRRSYIDLIQDLHEEARTDAMIIYNKYFSLQSDNRLYMSDKLRSHVEEHICSSDKLAYAFDLPLQTIAKYLEQKYLDEFLKSELFDNYVRELKVKLAQHDAFENLSEASFSSEQYPCSSQRNESQSSDDVNNKKTRHFNIDSRQLSNPQLLWQRSECPKLTFGRVNSLGRYERDFDTVDAASLQSNWSLSASSTKIKNAMRKLVNLPEDKMQEEIAWQMAEMIIKDVTSVTLSQDHKTT